MNTTTDSTTAPDQEHTPAIAAESTIPPLEVEIIPLDLGDDEMTDRDDFTNRMSVLFDSREEDLLGRLYDLQQDVAFSLDAANAVDCPKTMAAHLRNSASALKSAVVAIKALDKHRHGIVQKITVEYRSDGASLTLKTPFRDPRFAQSDEMIDELFLAHIEGFRHFENRCRKQAKILSQENPEELRRRRYRDRILPDRSTWETKFRGLASWLAGQTVKFTQTYETRHTRGQQHILVNRIGDVPLSKLGTKTVLPPAGADMPIEVCKPAEPITVVPFVKKANMEDEDAAA